MPAGIHNENIEWVANAAHLSIKQFEDVFLVFFRPSGDTHLLNFLSAAILEKLSEGKSTIEGMASGIWSMLELDPSDCPISLIESTVLQLDEVGLVSPIREETNV